MKTIWIWRDEEGAMRVQQVGTAPPAAGSVYEVKGAHSRALAEAFVATSLREEPNEDTDPQAWLAWRKAQKAVRPVDLQTEVTSG